MRIPDFLVTRPRVVVLNPMASDGIGPSHTCERLVNGLSAQGHDISLFVTRNSVRSRKTDIRTAIPNLLNYVPYGVVEDSAMQRAERKFLNEVKPSDIAWVWPLASLAVHEELARQGIPIILEAINTRMKCARTVLDAAYDAFGETPAHGITDERIAEEEAKWDLASAIFTPSPATEQATIGSALEGANLLCSYGTELTSLPATRDQSSDRVNFVFVGYACVRKGLHLLLEAWKSMPKTCHLTLVGHIEPAIERRFADILASEHVSTPGFTRNVRQHLRNADVFVLPSLEEGDPLVTYEAANAGLSLAVSDVGGGRIAAETGCAFKLDPTEPEQMRDALLALSQDAELRTHWGQKARKAVKRFGWNEVARRRGIALQSMVTA